MVQSRLETYQQISYTGAKMATMHGYSTLSWLVKCGWKAAPFEDDRGFVCGDQQVIDPQTNRKMNVYEAAKLHKERTGEYPEFLKDE
jgi:hypothetical protein